MVCLIHAFSARLKFTLTHWQQLLQERYFITSTNIWRKSMTTTPSYLLRIDSSSRHEGSISRTLGDAFVKAWQSAHPGSVITARDVVAQPLPHISHATIGGFFTPPDQLTADLKAATALSDELVGEIKAANDLLITVPMYNFSIPSSLKAWVDQIVRIRETFAFDGSSFAGLLQGKTAHVAVAYGASGYINGGSFADANFVEPYLRFILSFIGFSQVHFYSVESTSTNADAAQADLARATRQMQDVLASTEAAV
jgi:FMN-dependent NADH-azoreductase